MTHVRDIIWCRYTYLQMYIHTKLDI